MEFDYKVKAQEFESICSGNSRDVSIVIHRNPDGDAVGASLALLIWLQKKFNHKVRIIAPNRYSESLAWLPNSVAIMSYDSTLFHSTIDEHLRNSKLIICVDFGQKQRIDEAIVEAIEKNGANVCTIDHHLDNVDINSKYICYNPNAASVCEMIYEMLTSIDTITNDIAVCLYTGIVTDTARFMTSNTTPRVHDIISEILRNYTIDIAQVFKSVYGSNRISRLRFIGYVLSRCLHQIPGYNVAYIAISKEDARRFTLYPGDTDGIVSYALSIRNVVLAALFKERKDGIFISFRSIGDIDVSKMAAENFSGGGHKNASGGISKLSLKDTIKKFESIVKIIDILKNEHE